MSMWGNEPTNSGSVEETAWEEASDGLDPKVVRALRAEGVDPQHLGRAARFLDVMADDTVETLKRQAQYLRDDIPALFTAHEATAGGTTARPTARERGKALAAELGWTTKTGA